MEHVLIIGAGPAGLALAQGLERTGVPYTVFERDAFLDSRRQGYRLKLTSDIATKLQSTITAQAWSMVVATSAKVGLGETNLNATDAGISASRKESLPPGVEPPLAVDRGLLRRALVEGIQDRVQFGKKLVSYEVLAVSTSDANHNDGKAERVRVMFDDGTTAEGTLLVGADGSRSAVRAQYLPGYKFLDTGVCCIYGKSTLNAELKARFPKAHRRWITIVRDQVPIIQSIVNRSSGPITMVCESCHFSSRDIYSHIPEDYVHFGILFPKDFLGRGLSDESVDDSLRGNSVGISLDITSEWAPSIRALIELQDPDLTYGMRIHSAPGIIPAWTPSGRVTAIGDAVHLMSPTGGVGAVAALNDAVLLSRSIATDGISTKSIQTFEDGMREFSRACIARSQVAAGQMLDLPVAP